ncbi:MAG: hypothetical protein AAGC60_17725 [Acidobacteriota bacterium]
MREDDTPRRVLPVPFPAYNLRRLAQRCQLVQGVGGLDVEIGPGLVAFCHEVPVSRAELERRCPELALCAAVLEGLRHAAPSPDAILALCAGYVASSLRRSEPLAPSPPARPAWPADCPWPWSPPEGER